MPPKIALLLCILFIVFLFKFDIKHYTQPSHYQWIPLIWVAILSSRFLSQWLSLNISAGGGDLETGSPIDRAFFLFLIILALLILIKRRINLLQIIQKNKLIILFYSYCGISTLWSNYTFVGFKRWIKEIGNLLMILIILSDNDPFEAIKSIIRKCTYALIPLSILFIRYYSDIGRIYARDGTPIYTGVTMHKNTLGIICMVYGIFLIWNLLHIWSCKRFYINDKEILLNIIILLMIFWLLKVAQSATSLLCTILGISLIILTRTSIFKKKRKLITIYVLVGIFTFLSLEYTVGVIQVIVKSLGRDMTFTERVPLWNALIDMAANPLVGSGFGGFWIEDTIKKLWEIYSIHAATPHNGYLEIYLNTGIIGLVLFIGVIFAAYINAKNELNKNYEFGCLKIIFLFLILLHNVTETTFIRIDLLWFLFFLAAVNIP